MSADSLRSRSTKLLINSSVGEHNSKRAMGTIVRPQPVSEKTLIESVTGFINEVGLVPQPYSTNEEKDNSIVWTKFESIPKGTNLNSYGINLNGFDSWNPQQLPLMLTLAYPSGIQMWAVTIGGEAQEVLSWKRTAVRFCKILPTPISNPEIANINYNDSRPIVALVEGFLSPSSPNTLVFISLRTGEILKSTKFIHPVCDLLANSLVIVLSFLDKVLILDPVTFDTRISVACCPGNLSLTPLLNPIALGTSWLAFSDRKIIPQYQSIGGVEVAGTPSYTATVLYAAKSLTKGLKGLGETVANSITGHRLPISGEQNSSVPEPGVITILNLKELKSTCTQPTELSVSGNTIADAAYVAHFVAHSTNPIQAMKFDPSGLLLVTADKEGHDFHVFRIHPHPLGSSMGAIHHLYVLHRGDTGAKVQDISFASDSRWVAVSTLRGTTHIFPITPYGGPINVRTHTSHRVVNRLSRFHRTAGLDDNPTSGRSSPVLSYSPGSTSSNINSFPTSKSYDLLHLGSPYPNPRLPPIPHPLIIPPLAQLRQNFNLQNPSPKSSPPVSKSKGLLTEERVQVVSSFEASRGWLLSTPHIISHCDKRKKCAVDAIYVMTCHGNLIEYYLEPRPTTGIQKDKVSDDTSIELFVHAKAQWNFTRPSFLKELHPPLGPSSVILQQMNQSTPKCTTSNNNSLSNSERGDVSHNKPGMSSTKPRDESPDEKWLPHVEITTHSGPHRRLWMGPQFTFKVFNSTSTSSGNHGGMVDVETVELNVTTRPAKSNPVNMPVSSSLLPVVIEGSSGSSLEQSPRLVDPYSESESSALPSESHIKESLADAMLEGCTISTRDAGGCQNVGSCDDLSSSSFDTTSQHSVDAQPYASNFCIDATIPFPD